MPSEMKNMLNSHLIGNNQFSKGQLFNYFQNEKNTTKYLCLYTSHVIKNKVERETSIIEVTDNWQYKNHQEIFDDWDKTFKQNGIFEDTCEPYNIWIKAGIVKSNLKDLTDQIRKQIFGDFKEILRHNAISDKPNAFNKLLNLFIAKIIDENNTPDDEEVQFQWIEGYTTYEMLLDNLSKLYKQAISCPAYIMIKIYSMIVKKLIII